MSTSTPPTRCSEALLAAAAAAVAVLALLPCSGARAADPATDGPVTGSPPAQRGVALGLYSEDPDWDYGGFLDEIVAAGATHVSIVVPWYIATIRDTEVFAHPRYTVPMPTVERCILGARARGLEVFLFPILRVDDSSDGGWRGALAPRDVDAFFASYSEFILRFATLAERLCVPLLSIGSELGSMEVHERYWRALISRVREVYAGALTYSSNWDRYEQVEFFDDLDYAGVTGYFELVDKNRNPPPEPDIEELVHGWREQHLLLLRWQRRVDRPLILTEVGYLSQRGAAARPWDEGADEPIDLELQRRCYEAVRRVWDGERRLAGLYFWNWFGWGGPDSKEYTPRGKPAAAEVAAWYRAGATGSAPSP
ncbi:MAG TPA: hypothetical protein VM285_16615 [Polyangia bacterium]|nr:hypothetical protein [Polyangia bacterium]